MTGVVLVTFAGAAPQTGPRSFIASVHRANRSKTPLGVGI